MNTLLNKIEQLSKTVTDFCINTELKSGVIELTPSLAKYFLEHNAPFQRKINNRKVDHYKREIQNNNWQLNGDNISFDKNGDMINGQHRCHAVISANKSIYTVVILGLDSDSFKTMDQGFNRSNGSLFTMQGVKYANNLPTMLKIIYDNKKTGMINSKSSTPSFSEIEKLYKSDQDNFDKACSLSNTIVKSYKNTGFSSTTFLPFAYKAVLKSENDLIEFFHAIVHQNWTTMEGCPIKACYQRMERHIKKGCEVNSTTKYNILATAWNHYRKGSKLTVGMNKRFEYNKALELV